MKKVPCKKKETGYFVLDDCDETAVDCNPSRTTLEEAKRIAEDYLEDHSYRDDSDILICRVTHVIVSTPRTITLKEYK